MADITTGTIIPLTLTSSSASSAGIKLTPVKMLTLKKVTKSSTCTATRLRVYLDNNDNYGGLLATSSFNGNDAVVYVNLTAGRKYIFDLDSEGVSYTRHRTDATAFFPITYSDFIVNSGQTTGFQDLTFIYNILTLTYSIVGATSRNTGHGGPGSAAISNDDEYTYVEADNGVQSMLDAQLANVKDERSF